MLYLNLAQSPKQLLACPSSPHSFGIPDRYSFLQVVLHQTTGPMNAQIFIVLFPLASSSSNSLFQLLRFCSGCFYKVSATVLLDAVATGEVVDVGWRSSEFQRCCRSVVRTGLPSVLAAGGVPFLRVARRRYCCLELCSLSQRSGCCYRPLHQSVRLCCSCCLPRYYPDPAPDFPFHQ